MIEKIPLPVNVKGVNSFFGHTRFYKRFIKDFSKIAKSLSNLLAKDTLFDFNTDCVDAFHWLKETLVLALIM